METSPAVVGRYALLGRLASGGMGTVYRARLSREGGFVRDFALKRLHPHIAEDTEAVQMLLDEARLAAFVKHPNVVATLDVGKADGAFFVVMELVEGASLAELQETGGPLSSRVAARIVLDALEGLSAAHLAKDELGSPLEIVHRDVSPANVLVGRDGIAKLIDFGVAKARERLRTTVGVEVKGKLGYMPPEQFEGDLVDARADLFATGVVLWELLRGERLLLGNRGRLKELEESGEPPWFATGAGHAIDAVVRRAIRRDPNARFGDARAMADALREAAVASAGVAAIEEVASRVADHEVTVEQSRASAESVKVAIDRPDLSDLSGRPSRRRESTDVVAVGAAWATLESPDAEGSPVREVTLVLDPPPPSRPSRRSRRALLLAAFALAGCAVVAVVARHRAPAASAVPAAPLAAAVAMSPVAEAEPAELAPAASTVAANIVPAGRDESAPRPKHPLPRKPRAHPSAAEPTRAPDDPFGGRH